MVSVLMVSVLVVSVLMVSVLVVSVLVVSVCKAAGSVHTDGHSKVCAPITSVSNLCLW